MILPMASYLVLRSLSLASLVIPSTSLLCFLIDSDLSLALSLSLSDALRIFPIYFYYPNRELSLPSISMDVYF